MHKTRKDYLRALKQRLSYKYGMVGTILGSLILFFGIFIVPFTAFTCINCALPIVAALGLTGTVAGLAGKNVYIISIGISILLGSGYLILRKNCNGKTCHVQGKKRK